MAKKEPAEDKGKAPELSVLQSWLDYGKQTSRKTRYQWFVIDQFLRGNHNVRGNQSTNTIEVSKSTNLDFPINRIYSTFRAVRAYVTRHKPIVEVEPEDSSDDASVQYARRASALLRRDNKLNHSRHINKEWVYYGVKDGVGYRQVGYDSKKKCAIRWTVDPADMFIASATGQFEDAPAVIKAVKRTVGYLKNKYPKSVDLFAPDNKLAEDDYKAVSLSIQYPDAQSVQNNLPDQTQIVYEAWYRLFEPNKTGGLINKVSFVQSGVIEESFEETPYEEYPFIPYYADITPNELYPEGHLKHVISPQRLYNLLNTHAVEYNHIVNRGRIIKDKNAGFRVINTKEGQIIEKKPGAQVSFLNPAPPAQILQWQTEQAIAAIEDIGGQHDASVGATPSRVSSGKAIEALQTGDSNNISDLRDNFEDALEKEAVWILYLYSIFEPEGIVMADKMNDQPDKFAIMGQGALDKLNKQAPSKYYIEDNGSYCDVMALLPENKVKVSVSSELGETKEARLDLLFKLIEAGLPLKFLLEYLEFPNSTNILQRIAEESVADMAMEAMKAQGSMPPQDPAAQGPTPEAQQMEQVMAEMQSMSDEMAKMKEDMGLYKEKGKIEKDKDKLAMKSELLNIKDKLRRKTNG